jgi:hypothetical protein
MFECPQRFACFCDIRFPGSPALTVAGSAPLIHGPQNLFDASGDVEIALLAGEMQSPQQQWAYAAFGMIGHSVRLLGSVTMR